MYKGLTVSLLTSLLVAAVACESNRNDNNGTPSQSAQEETVETQAPKAEAIDTTTDSFEGETSTLTIHIPNSLGGRDTFSITQPLRHETHMERVQPSYEGSSSDLETSIEKEITPQLSIYKTVNNNLIIAYYYETPSNDEIVSEETMGNFYVFKYGHENANWKHYTIGDDQKIAALAEQMNSSILEARQAAHMHYFENRRRSVRNYSLVLQDWDYAVSQILEAHAE
ncbi:MAG: hypothetical protein HRT44_08170 [Bdellovibrionales bacterium]|nr:hypothetical protein [Bdellovibrionales bacterium]NQZ19214.1 hypothetical protein [Bdellovibrionales bacterium]